MSARFATSPVTASVFATGNLYAGYATLWSLACFPGISGKLTDSDCWHSLYTTSVVVIFLLGRYLTFSPLGLYAADFWTLFSAVHSEDGSWPVDTCHPQCPHAIVSYNGAQDPATGMEKIEGTCLELFSACVRSVTAKHAGHSCSYDIRYFIYMLLLLTWHSAYQC